MTKPILNITSHRHRPRLYLLTGVLLCLLTASGLGSYLTTFPISSTDGASYPVNTTCHSWQQGNQFRERIGSQSRVLTAFHSATDWAGIQRNTCSRKPARALPVAMLSRVGFHHSGLAYSHIYLSHYNHRALSSESHPLNELPLC